MVGIIDLLHVVIKWHVDVMTRGKQGEFDDDLEWIEVVTHSRYVLSLVKLPIGVNEMPFRLIWSYVILAWRLVNI